MVREKSGKNENFLRSGKSQGKALILSRSGFPAIWYSPKVKHRFVDFFAMVPRSLSKVNFKCINESFAFSSG